MLGGLLGGQKTRIPASGFYAMPQDYQNFYKKLLDSGNSVLFPGGQLNSEMFAPMAQTADETAAFDRIRSGLAPTEASLRSDIAMQMNPFDDYVINDINRQAAGENSLVNQYSSLANQQGSNRSFLGTSDVEQNRLNEIGKFRQGQYNTAVQNALGPMAQLKQADIENLLGIGTFQRGLDSATRQAPLSALQAGQGILNGFPTQFGQFGGPETTVKTGGGLGGILGGLGSLGSLASGLGGLAGAAGFGGTASTLGSIGTALGFFSDERLKENIVKVGEENGHNIYNFNYIGGNTKVTGVLAQEVQKICPEAVFEENGYLKVNYEKIGIEMRVHG